MSVTPTRLETGGIEPPHVVLAHVGTDPMAFASADTGSPKPAVTERRPRFTRPELDFAAVEKQRLDGPPVLGDSRGENF